MVDHITVHETRFFRHEPSINILRKNILMNLFDKKNKRNKIRFWSVGCSTGEEAYTIAMVTNFFKHGLYYSSDCKIEGIGTDIAIPTLEIAKKANYSEFKVKKVPNEYRSHFFKKMKNGHYQIVHKIKNQVKFMPFNLIDMNDLDVGTMDLIFCQNVLIYFDKKRRLDIVNQLVKRLNTGGFLVLGAGEMPGNFHDKLVKISCSDTLVFTKK